MTLVDSNVLLDLVTDDENWAAWSAMQLQSAAARGDVVINDVVYAEVSTRFASIELLEQFLTEAKVTIVATPREALFLAGKTFVRYRRAGGIRTGVLADFFIGACATVMAASLLSRDPRHYRTYFPTIKLIAP